MGLITLNVNINIKPLKIYCKHNTHKKLVKYQDLSKQIKNANMICSINSNSKNTIECLNMWKTIDQQALLYIEQHYYTDCAIQEIFKLYNE